MPNTEIDDKVYLILQEKLLGEEFDDIEKCKFGSKFDTFELEYIIDDLRLDYSLSLIDFLKLQNSDYNERRNNYIQAGIDRIKK